MLEDNDVRNGSIAIILGKEAECPLVALFQGIGSSAIGLKMDLANSGDARETAARN